MVQSGTPASLHPCLIPLELGKGRTHLSPTNPCASGLSLQHIGLPMFSLKTKPRRIHMMSLGVLNLPRHPVLDWAFGHSIISCHVEHHLFPTLSDNMCLKVGALGWRGPVSGCRGNEISQLPPS